MGVFIGLDPGVCVMEFAKHTDVACDVVGMFRHQMDGGAEGSARLAE